MRTVTPGCRKRRSAALPRRTARDSPPAESRNATGSDTSTSEYVWANGTSRVTCPKRILHAGRVAKTRHILTRDRRSCGSEPVDIDDHGKNRISIDHRVVEGCGERTCPHRHESRIPKDQRHRRAPLQRAPEPRKHGKWVTGPQRRSCRARWPTHGLPWRRTKHRRRMCRCATPQ